MKPIPLSDLPRWSPWPARLLGLASWHTPERTVAKVAQEYDKEKYAQLLDYYEQHDGITPEQVELHNYGLEPDRQWCVLVNNALYEVTVAEARNRYYSLLRETLGPLAETCPTLVELGCGYGYNLWMLKQHLKFSHYAGGDYSTNAVRLAEFLYRDDANLNVASFNYYDADTYAFLATLPAPIVVFTSHSLEQIPCSEAVFNALSNFADRIHRVIHFEPVYQLYDESLLGQMCRRYTQLNHYNLDLLTQLQTRSAIQIDEIKANVFGLNMLNPTSVLNWSFANKAA